MNDTQIIQAIKAGGAAENQALEYLYHDEKFQFKAKAALFPPNQLRLETWEDVFHESLIRLVTQIQLNRYEGESGLIHYFAGICRMVRMEKWRKENKEAEMPEMPVLIKIISDFFGPEDLIHIASLKGCLQDAIQTLKERCRSLLKLWAMGIPSKKIAEKLEFKSEQVVNVSINRCKKNLRESLKENPQLMNILKDLR